MEDDAIELKWRSMKTNLIFTGIQFQPEENTKDKLNSFIKQKLKIDKRVNFDKEIVLKNGYKLKETQFGVKEQFPKEIEQQRKPLYPVAKQARKEKRKVRMVRDKLYIDGDLYKPNTKGDGNENIHDVLSFIQQRNITQQYERSTNEPQLSQLPRVQTIFDYQTVKNSDDSIEEIPNN
ncbi:unnamed protein product [Mytilus edulis]|uniref:Uncharacterized protein n=1 Tax=Mytilus edulis TaxID=6550 RepID=A0A8S3RMK0_MYTED|nr:unnamed protein product [Mytilus edulis]